jgi:argininosuccinate lyase
VQALDRGVELNELSLNELQSFSSLIESEVFASLSLEQTLGTKTQIGGTAPNRVEAELKEARARL